MPTIIAPHVPLTVDSAAAIHREFGRDLMDLPGVVGSGISVDHDGNPYVEAYLASGDVRGIPARFYGIPVQTEVTGPFELYTSRNVRDRPARLGFSIGHPDVTAGTLGARVVDDFGRVYILGNNHILANANRASIGDPILQPAPAHGGGSADSVAWLADFEPFDFNGPNYMDAAIARTTAATVAYWTPLSDAYGAPSPLIWGDADYDLYFDDLNSLVGVTVQKYGLETGLTTGTVAKVGRSVQDCTSYTSCLEFVDHIFIEPASFANDGDSGALVVTVDGNHPVGIILGGTPGYAVASRIDGILRRFDVEIDGGTSVAAQIQGEQCLYEAGNESYFAQTSGGTETYSWVWYRDRAPYDGWVQAGAGSSITLYFAGGSYGEKIKVVATDAAGRVGSDNFQVYMESGLLGPSGAGTNATACANGGMDVSD